MKITLRMVESEAGIYIRKFDIGGTKYRCTYIYKTVYQLNHRCLYSGPAEFEPLSMNITGYMKFNFLKIYN